MWNLMQENASVLKPKYTLKWLVFNKVCTLEWPAKSTDFDIIENVWSALARKDGSSGMKFRSFEELGDAVYDCW